MLRIDEIPQDDNHHRSSFIPSCEEIQEDIHSIFPPEVDFPLSPMTSTSNDLDPVVDMVISLVVILDPDLLTISGLICKCGHKPISLDPPGSRTKQDRIILFP
jgi:hypothetical protein